MTDGIGAILSVQGSKSPKVQRSGYNLRVPARHHEVSRIEAFSDAVFGFALTLLVVSLEPLKDVPELLGAMRKAGPFALTFAMVCWIWWQHNQFFRRYGLQDAWTATLNCVLLFVVLMYVYPLRFLTESLTGGLFGIDDRARLHGDNGPAVLLLYSVGVFCIFATFVLLHMHAWRQRAALGLTPAETINLRFAMRAHLISMSLAVVSIIITLALPAAAAIAGFTYALMGPLHAWNGFSAGRAHAALATPSTPAE